MGLKYREFPHDHIIVGARSVPLDYPLRDGTNRIKIKVPGSPADFLDTLKAARRQLG